jgi:hypothetical protein
VWSVAFQRNIGTRSLRTLWAPKHEHGKKIISLSLNIDGRGDNDRLDELKQVIVKVHGGKYRWTWKKFKVAMMNMGCEYYHFAVEYFRY